MGDLHQDIESIFVACFSNKTKKKEKFWENADSEYYDKKKINK